MNKIEMLDVMNYIFADHDIAISEDKLRVWHDQFKHIAQPIAMQAAKLVTARNTYGIPKAYHLHEALAELTFPDLDPTLAWTHAIQAVKRFGRNRPDAARQYLDSIHPELGSIVSTIYIEICNSPESQLSTLRSQFWKMCEGAKARAHMPPGISGAIAGNNPRVINNLPELLTALEDVSTNQAHTNQSNQIAGVYPNQAQKIKPMFPQYNPPGKL